MVLCHQVDEFAVVVAEDPDRVLLPRVTFDVEVVEKVISPVSVEVDEDSD